jgi:flagellar basal body P-ring formation protein FlgA
MFPSSLIVSGLLFLITPTGLLAQSVSQQEKQDSAKDKSPKAKITLKRSARVPGTRVLLGDIATVDCKDTDYARYLSSIQVGATPKSRWARWISKDAVHTSLRLQKVDVKTLDFAGKERVEVMALLDQIPAQDFLKQAEIALKAILADQGEMDAEWKTTSRLRPIVIPRPREGYELLARSDGNKVRLNQARFFVDIKVDGEIVQKVQVAFKLSRFRRVLVTRLRLKPGEDYTSENTQIKRIDIAGLSLPEDMAPLTQLSQTRGRVAARNMRTGAVLFETDLARPYVVKKGEVVTVIAKVGKIHITTEGHAQKDGGVGDRIPVLVRRKKTNITIQAEVLGAGTVTVTIRNGSVSR